MRQALIGLAAFFTLAGGAVAAETAMKMDCCKNCACCKDKATPPKDGQPKPETPPQAPVHQH